MAAPTAVLADPPAPPKPAPAASSPSPAATGPDTPADDVAFYPAAARAAGLEGQAVITCERNEHLALRACTLVSETPAGQGFGAAALALAAKSPDNPKVDIADPKVRPPITVTVNFRLHPAPGIYPDLSQMGHTVLQPALLSAPTFAQIQAAYPVRALSDGVDGVAILDCFVTDKGRLDACRLYAENPTGYGFGAAALDLAADFTLEPRRFDGDPVGGAEVHVPVPFQVHDPTAPLELKTTPSQ
ncbi:MAG TPA: energy transducer TonB [Caulobacteraceae bacterium]|nr:energy transducer TonB [Caulobacteraceae bacterium]